MVQYSKANPLGSVQSPKMASLETHESIVLRDQKGQSMKERIVDSFADAT